MDICTAIQLSDQMKGDSNMNKKRSGKRTLKKVFLNLCVILFALIFTGNIIARENAGQINQVLGTKTSETINTGDGSEGYARYATSSFDSVKALKAAGEAKVREVESEGIVLLKNEGTLPLAAGSKVSLVGVTVMDPVYGGTGSGAVDADGASNYYDVLTGAGFNVVDKALLDYYVENENKRNAHEIGEVRWKKVAKNNDDTIGQGEDVIFVVGRVGGEGDDVTAEKEDALDGDYLTLNEDELSILEGLAELKADGDIRSITVIINSANPISTGFLFDKEYNVDAALWVGSVGQTGIYAVGDVLAGTVNPSGALPDTWWMDNRLDPVMNNFGSYTYAGADKYNFSSAYSKYVVYQEGIYLGYKYTETRYEDAVLGTENAGNFNYSAVVSYPFGYSQSYTTFELSDMKVEKSGEGQKTAYTVSVNVTNTGSAAGKKSVQIYAQKPYTQYDRDNQIEKAAVELVGYSKTQILEPGASETVAVNVPEYYLTSYDTFNTGVFILEDGTYYLTAATDAHDAVNNILAVKGHTIADGMTKDGNTALVYRFDQTFDAETYATSYGTGAKVSALFADADMNRYEGRGDNSITYYSRSNWEGTVSSGPVSLSMTDAIAKDVVLDDSDLPDASGTEFPKMGVNANLQLINMRDYAFDDPMWDTFMDQLSYEDLSTLTLIGLRETASVSSVGKPGTIDHNGPSGVTQKYSIGSNGYAVQNNDPDKDLKGTAYPCNGIIAATFNDTLAREVGELIGEDAMWAGYAGLYGTGLNIHRSPYSGRVFEYYSEDGMLTGLIDTAETVGIQSKGVYVYNKHFVMNDQENNRAGIGTWVTEQALREQYLRAFELPIVNADAKCVMTGYNRLGVNWCGAYAELLLDWLRTEAGMDGFAVSDMYDLSYMVPVHEILAGNDIPDGELDLSYLSAYGPKGSTPTAKVAQAMRASAKRILYTVLHSRGMDGISLNTKVISITPWWQTTLDVCQWVFLALSVLALLLLLLDIYKEQKAK
ncbi:MAG: glycoside hydrolase family 3 protein [Clostridia bacterium]|nr:glycoside hydrolase family 3 protein [Clostridia bacterium]